MAAKNKEIALQAQNTGYLALANNDIGAMMAEELDGLDAGFERIKIPSAGSTVFEMPGEGDEAETVKEFSAVILCHHTLFAYYKSNYTGGNNPPDCGSFDGIVGEGDPGGHCKTCPLNQFGSGENGAKACKNRRRVYVLKEGEIFPLLLSLPTGSLKEFTRYIKRLLSKGRKSNAVVTRFSLKKATSNTGVLYSQAQFAVDRPLSPEEHSLIEKLSEQVRAFSSRVAYDYDATASEDEEFIVDPETGEVIEPLGDGADV
jgi:uncharacterized FlaG/YvyC family protein